MTTQFLHPSKITIPCLRLTGEHARESGKPHLSSDYADRRSVDARYASGKTPASLLHPCMWVAPYAVAARFRARLTGSERPSADGCWVRVLCAEDEMGYLGVER